ncbi:hypothetical protein RSAG8_09148, partial [Rhizoctonia solani AG-8 WAC10335]
MAISAEDVTHSDPYGIVKEEIQHELSSAWANPNLGLKRTLLFSNIPATDSVRPTFYRVPFKRTLTCSHKNAGTPIYKDDF